MNSEHQEFVTLWLQTHFETSVVDAQFHDEFHKKFGGDRVCKNWGASPVRAAMHTLKEMWKAGMIKRNRIGLQGSWQPGFPKWVYSYQSYDRR